MNTLMNKTTSLLQLAKGFKEKIRDPGSLKKKSLNTNILQFTQVLEEMTEKMMFLTTTNNS